MKRLGLLLFAALLLAVLGVGGWWLSKRDGSQDQADKPQSSSTKVEKGSIRVAVSSTGRVVSNLDVEIKCKASGQIINLPVDISSSVKKGDLLVELDPVDEKRLLQQAEVSLASAEARLAQSKQQLDVAEKNLATEKRRAEAALKSAQARAVETAAKSDRVRALWEKKLISEEAYETARTTAVSAAADRTNAEIRIDELKNEESALGLKREDVKIAEGQVASNQIDLSIAQQRVKDIVVLAPMDGVVSARNVQIGQIISSGISNVGGGTTALVLSDLSRLFVLAAVDESDIGKVQLGQRARITADAFPGNDFRGEVVRIATRGVNTSNVVTFEVKIEVTGKGKELLKPEMTANVEILAAEKDDVLLVSSDALVRRRGQRFVTVLKPDGVEEEREIQVGLTDGVQFEVLDGLAEGEQVLVRDGGGDSRWRQGGDANRQRGMAQRIMMGGGGRRGGGR